MLVSEPNLMSSEGNKLSNLQVSVPTSRQVSYKMENVIYT